MATAAAVVPIGTFMVDYIERPNAVGASTNATTPTNSLLLPSSTTPTPSNMLVKGLPKSGKTSLVMDLVHSVATHAPCRGACTAPCTCVAAVLLRTATKSSFPLCCHQVQPESDFQAQLKALDAPKATWNKAALRRIQVHHLESMTDLLHYLLGLQGRDDRDRPSGCIVLDDIESFVSTGEDQRQLSMPETMNLVQIMAILADTGSTLSRLQHAPVSVVATLQSTSLSVNVERIISQWFPMTKTLTKAAPGWKPPLADGEGIEQVWSTGSENYAVVREDNGARKIVWAVA